MVRANHADLQEDSELDTDNESDNESDDAFCLFDAHNSLAADDEWYSCALREQAYSDLEIYEDEATDSDFTCSIYSGNDGDLDLGSDGCTDDEDLAANNAPPAPTASGSTLASTASGTAKRRRGRHSDGRPWDPHDSEPIPDKRPRVDQKHPPNLDYWAKMLLTRYFRMLNFCHFLLNCRLNSNQEAKLDEYAKSFLNPGPRVESYPIQQVPMTLQDIDELKRRREADQVEGLEKLRQLRERIKHRVAAAAADACD